MPITIAGTAVDLNRHDVQYSPDIKSALRQELEWERNLVPRVSPKNTYTVPNVTIGEILQQYQWKFTPKNDVTLDGLSWKLQKIKIDILFTAEDLEEFWDSWMVEWHEIGLDEVEWSFPRWIYQNQILPKVLEEMNYNAYWGQYVAPTDNVAGVSINTVDGYKKHIEDAILAGDLTALSTGAFADSTIVNQLESWCDQLPIPYRNKAGKIYMSDTLATKYWRNYRDLFGTGNSNENNANNELRIDRTRKMITPVNSMEGSDRIIFFPEVTKNMFWLSRRNMPTYPSIRWKSTDVRVLKGTAEFYRGYGFAYWDHLFVNDLT